MDEVIVIERLRVSRCLRAPCFLDVLTYLKRLEALFCEVKQEQLGEGRLPDTRLSGDQTRPGLPK